MKNFAGKTKNCKTPNCNKEAWIDGYCKKCAEYIIQKKTLSSLEKNSKLIFSISSNMKQIEDRISNLESGEKNINYGSQENIHISKINPKPKVILEDDVFIPSISINNDKAILIDNQTIKSDKNISDIAKKLPNI